MFISASGEEQLDKVAQLQNHPEQILFQTNWVKRIRLCLNGEMTTIYTNMVAQYVDTVYSAGRGFHVFP